MTYAADGETVTSALEGPLGQYAYPLDPLFATPTGTPGRIGGLVGVADLVAADPSRYLLLVSDNSFSAEETTQIVALAVP